MRANTAISKLQCVQGELSNTISAPDMMDSFKIDYESKEFISAFEQGSETIGTNVLAGLLHVHTGEQLKVGNDLSSYVDAPYPS